MDELELFVKATAVTNPAERLGLLDRECAGQPELRERMDQLLEAHRKANPWLDAATFIGDASKSLHTEAAGMLIAGRYKLLEQIGEGGMGTVWMAEQTEPVKRRVAVKLIHTERGNTKKILARFDAERQAIALMDHPHIAKLLDAGTWSPASPGGGMETPFFAMELVKGIPLNQYCDVHQLSIPDRLKLFTQICSAVQHAHQKGIIHRDIKPSNILVECHDDKPVPKVIDFGLAKATTGLQLTENTLFTGFGMVMGTPLYMSPEQAKFNATDIDTRADIYALGVVLYELLTGTTPLTQETLKQAALDELMRLIREQQAPTPSSRLSSSESKPSVCTNRQTEPDKLTRFMRGELDWIVMKAISKDRDRRYQTANAFAQDIERFLNHEPVTAYPPTAWYRLKKFVQRNKGRVIAAGLVLLALMAGVIGTTLGWVEARRQANIAVANEEIAIAEKSKAEAAAAAEKLATDQTTKRLIQIEKGNKLLAAIFDDLDIRKVKDDIEPLEAVLAKRLVQAGKQLDGESIGDPLVVAALQNQLGRTLLSLGFAKDSIRLLRTAKEVRANILGKDHPDTLMSMFHLTTSYLDDNQSDLALPLCEEVVKIMKEKWGTESPHTLASMNNLALSYKNTGRNDKALPLYEETLNVRKATLGPDHSEVLISMNNLAMSYQAAGKNDLARSLLEEVLKLTRTRKGVAHPDTITSMNNLAMCYTSAGRNDLAIPLFEETYLARKARQGVDHPRTLIAMANLAVSYRKAGKNELALPLCEEALELRKARLGADHPDTLESMNILAISYRQAGKIDLAIPLFKETLNLRKIKLGVHHQDTLASMNNLAWSYRDAGKNDLALPLCKETLELRKAKLGVDHTDTITSMDNLALCYQDAGKNDLALQLCQETLKLRKEKLGADHPDTLASMNNLASIYSSAGRHDLALPLYVETLTLRRMKLGEEHPETLNSMNNLASAYWQTKQLDKSTAMLEKTLELKQKKLGRQHPDTLSTICNLGVNYRDANRMTQAIPLLEEGYRASQKHPVLSWVGIELLDAYLKNNKPQQAKTLLKELLFDARSRQPKESSQLAGKLVWIGSTLLQNKAFADAESIFRECLTIREKAEPDAWTTSNMRSMLGGALLGQKKYTEAEPLLIKGYQGLKTREKAIPLSGQVNISQAIDRLIRLYSETQKPDELKKYQSERKMHPDPASAVNE